ncbi:MAG: thiamine phosphate synthase [Candidatus Diapherotrites archaeon]|nr:thiamine phosphate synthase [Candidatus Diapherotrites archaeon]
MYKKISNKMGLYFITDSRLTKQGIIKDVKDALESGVKVIQYREKNKPTREMLVEAIEIKKMCKKKKAIFLVNDRLDIALASKADGIHIGQDDMPIKYVKKLMPYSIIGVTVHNIKEALEAEKKGASYLGVSPIFETSTKSDAGKAIGVEALEHIMKKVKVPVVAIGGINEDNLQSVLKTGCRNIAMISAILKYENVRKRCEEFNKIILKE